MFQENQALLIVSLACVLVGALSVNYYFYRRQEAETARRIKIKQLKAQLEQVLDTLTVLKQTPCNPQLVSSMESFSLDLIGQIQSLDKNGDFTNKLQGKTHVPPTQEIIFHSDSSIKLAQRSIRNGTSLLVKLKSKGRLTPLLFAEYSRELSWIHSLIEAEAHIEMGKKLLESSKISIAVNHFKHAKSTISKTSGKDPRKQIKLNEIKELIEKSVPAESSAQASKITPLDTTAPNQ
ncbi:hypothetical protein [Motiliproteus sp. MSK22-1]|uniref:hypothetical protein n=1 Tax=Motiliproteus sp. MSK22-1 TaxID=1897630 RepID=UPI000975FAF2|nr:hypothetical protein [Motiliproteus sp. MSK22-1]OMH38727.1 hypothetical protein BGP75_05935 [Motiliproteus sp. MSK22-1]